MRIIPSRAFATAALAAVTLAALHGCGAAVLVQKAFAGPAFKAEYHPPKEKPLAIVVYADPATGISQDDMDRVAMTMEQALTTAEAAPVVPVSKVMEYREDGRPPWNAATLAECGKKLGAAEVIFVRITLYAQNEVIGGTNGYRMEARVKVYDTDNASVLWPTSDFEGARVQVASTPKHMKDSPFPALGARAAAFFFDREEDDK